MILTQDQIEGIVAGRKTEHRMPIPKSWRTPRHINIRRRHGGPVIVRLTSSAVRSQQLGKMTEDDARAEGFKTLYDFQQWWLVKYGGGAVDLTKSVAVLTVEVDRSEPPRLLAQSSPAARHRRGCQAMDGTGRDCNCRPDSEADHGYTDRRALAMPDEPEAVSARDQAEMVKRIEARLERVRKATVRRQCRQLHAELDRLTSIPTANAEAHRSHLRAIRHKVNGIEQALG